MNTTEQNINEAMSLEYQAIDRVKRHGEQVAFDAEVLRLWARAKEAGFTPEQVKAFTFRFEYLTNEQKEKNRDALRYRKPPVYCDKNWHNALRLCSGRIVSMPGITRPTPPGWMPTSVERKL